MEIVPYLVIGFIALGGLQWCLKRFLEARDVTRRFLAAHHVAYRGAGCLAFLSGTGVALLLAFSGPDGQVSVAVVTGLVVALIGLPGWLVALLVTGFFYRNFLRPTLEVLGYLCWPIQALVAAVTAPARRKADGERAAQAAAAREWARQSEEQAKAVQAQEALGKRRDQKRRENARSRCEVLYHLHAPEIGKRFTRAMFDDYMRKYMVDSLEVEEVEERAARLEKLLLEHLERVQPPPRFRSLEDIARWFEQQKQQLDRLPDERTRKTLLVKLKARYTDLTTEFLEEMRA